MTTIENLTDITRVKVRQTKNRRVAEYQQKEGELWLTKCIRPYINDIRVNPKTDIIRVAKQQGYDPHGLMPTA